MIYLSKTIDDKLDDIYKNSCSVDKQLAVLSVTITNIESKTKDNHKIITNGLTKTIKDLAKRINDVESCTDKWKGTATGVGALLTILTLVSSTKILGLW